MIESPYLQSFDVVRVSEHWTELPKDLTAVSFNLSGMIHAFIVLEGVWLCRRKNPPESREKKRFISS